MKAVEKNISRHANGNYYFVARRQGKLITISLKTATLGEARRKAVAIRSSLSAQTAPKASPSRIDEEDALTDTVEVKREASSFNDDLERHIRSLIFLSTGTEEMAKRGKAVVERYCADWASFAPIEIWNRYRDSRKEKLGGKLGSAANHLRWYLRKLVPWAVREGLLQPATEIDLASIPKVKVNPRTIRVPSPEKVDEFLRMVAAEDKEGADFLRFLAATGLRKSGALGLRWENIDFANSKASVRMKGGSVLTLPISEEALSILKRRMTEKVPRPWPLDEKAMEKLERKMKRFAKGLDLDLKTFHSFRHYFTSRALMGNLTVQEVATLLGHKDGGVLLLKTYGHICSSRLQSAVSTLRLTE